MLLGVLSLAWAFGATIGLPQEVAARRTIVGALINGIDGVLTLAAGVGVLLMIHRTGEHLPKWLPLAMTWAGTGSLFGWGLWQTINVLGETALLQGAGGGAFVKLVGLFRMLVGLTMGLLTLFVIAEHRDTASTVPNH
jgi:hypothetical protein